MSETIINRVAKAIHESLGYETPWETCTQCEGAARAAIEALREAGRFKPLTYDEAWEFAIADALKEASK